MPHAASSLEILVTSSLAAFSVKVATRMLEGSTPFACTRYDTRLTRVKVFPVPGPAVMSRGPSVEVIARRCASFALPKSKLVAAFLNRQLPFFASSSIMQVRTKAEKLMPRRAASSLAASRRVSGMRSVTATYGPCTRRLRTSSARAFPPGAFVLATIAASCRKSAIQISLRLYGLTERGSTMRMRNPAENRPASAIDAANERHGSYRRTRRCRPACAGRHPERETASLHCRNSTPPGHTAESQRRWISASLARRYSPIPMKNFASG